MFGPELTSASVCSPLEEAARRFWHRRDPGRLRDRNRSSFCHHAPVCSEVLPPELDSSFLSVCCCRRRRRGQNRQATSGSSRQSELKQNHKHPEVCQNTHKVTVWNCWCPPPPPAPPHPIPPRQPSSDVTHIQSLHLFSTATLKQNRKKNTDRRHVVHHVTLSRCLLLTLGP